jgi:acetyltransferase
VLTALETMLRHVSDMVCALPWLAELDINPIIVSRHSAVAVDARAMLTNATAPRHRFEHLAISPYPAHLTRTILLHDKAGNFTGEEYTIRAIRPDDGARLQAMVQSMSPEARYFRFAQSVHTLPPRMVSRYTLIDYERAMALVATVPANKTDELIIAVARYAFNSDGESCEFALAVADAWNGKGIGTTLMKALIECARQTGLQRIEGIVMRNNSRMLRLMQSLGFHSEVSPDDDDMRLVTLSLVG